MREILSNTLTTQEAGLGFRRVWIENGRNRFGNDGVGEPHVLEAVVYPVSESKWIFKIVPPEGVGHPSSVVYKEMGYGKSGISEHGYPEWRPIRTADYGDPEDAIWASQKIASDVTLVLAMPRFEGGRGNRRILFKASQIDSGRIERHGGELVTRDGAEWGSFAVIE
jgi:hypothetical protein